MAIEKEFTRQEAQKLWDEVKDITEALKEIDKFLDDELKTASPVEENIIHIVPGIKAGFDNIKSKQMRIDNVIQIYSEWVDELYTAVVLNKGYYKNNKIKEHIQNATWVCGTLIKVLEHHQKK